MRDDYKSRKFVMSMIFFITATGLLYLKLIDGEVWKFVTCMIFGGYVVGNVAQKYLTPDPSTPPV